MNGRTTPAVSTPAGCTTPFEMETGVRHGDLAGPFLLNFVVDDIMRRTGEQGPADVILASSARPLVDLEYADDVIMFASSNAKFQHAVNLASKLAAAYGLRHHPDRSKHMRASRDLQRESGGTYNLSNSWMSSVIWAVC
ncbi:hypothetical protein RB195_023093 [Necator americanus]